MPGREPNWDPSTGLLPAIVQDADSGRVLMMAWFNEESLKKTKDSGDVTFFSRSKKRLWTKGEESGNRLKLVSITLDCDQDAFLVLARPLGPACHEGTRTCFEPEPSLPIAFISDLEKKIDNRFRERPEGSYISKLIERGLDRMAQKVGEEAVEVVIASKGEDRDALTGEAADLLFHLMVLLRAKGISLGEVASALLKRAK